MSNAFVMAKCPKCKKLQPHKTAGADSDPDGRKYQTMVCTVCSTSTKVYIGQRGDEFQANYDLPDNTDLGEDTAGER